MADDKTAGGLPAAADRIRETAKWLTVALGGLGTVLVAGSQLSSIGSLDPGSERLYVAIAAAVGAALGAALILMATARTATTPAISLKQLAAETPPGTMDVVTDRTLLMGEADVAGFYEKFQGLLQERTTALNAHYTNPQQSDLKVVADAAQNQALLYAHAGLELVGIASYASLAHRWKWSVRLIIVGSIIAAASIGCFAWAANPPEDAKESSAAANVLAAPSEKSMTLTKLGVSTLSKDRGNACPVDNAINVLILGSTPAGPDVLIS